ncbi:MAG: MotA/TolQ/ExbB proton channel family protein [Magnetococcales bacterium]|nr:MotA/TolQ/ExbB proton channel family protein [Magnetococcales bacterium]
MDIASVIGLILGIGIVIGLMGHKITLFWSLHAVVVVVGGLLGSTFLKFSMSDIMSAGKILKKALFADHEDIKELIRQMVDISNIARKNGLLALEKVKVENEFLQAALQHCSDGVDPKLMKEILTKEIEYMAERHHTGVVMWESMGEAAPAFGMVGTLIGMVELLANMSDPSSIGPAMSTALLATMYGAFLANAIIIPMGIKLHHYSMEEQMKCSMIVDGVIGIQTGLNTRMLEQVLKTCLSRYKRDD